MIIVIYLFLVFQKKLLIGNEQLLKVAFINLMDKACKYSTDHRVEILLSKPEKGFVATFVDKGIGMDEEDLSEIFQPFFRAKNSINIPGNGLGLSLTEKIVQVHKGEISIVSEINVGTRVTIVLPYADLIS